jgi:hypothetical protein
MQTATLSNHVASIRATLSAIETQLNRGRIPPQALADFKTVVDDIRLRVWNIMAASRAEDYPNALERFRIRRAMEITRSVAEGLRSGAIKADLEELPDLQQLAGTLVLAVDEVRVGRA